MMKIYNSILELVGNTPLVKLNNVMEAFNLKANLYAKIEAFNPGGSVKDRAALQMIEDLEKEGVINQDTLLIEPTSGNTGIGLAFIANFKGYNLTIVMPDSMSKERIDFMKSYGAHVILTPGINGMNGAIKKAKEIQEANPGSIIVGQFVNESNPKAHYLHTAPEIYEALDGKVDALVAGIGTGGTISGVGRYLKEQNENIRVIG
ncbi:MAG: cysteine synthase family protein, partial [Gammaproteobacteria bacterium]|nr:cysteine synthase family protein [Gammaproteobacteria bacterium]